MIQSIAVIGAKGRMGSLFVARCQSASFSVAELDLPLPDAELDAALPHVDLVLLSVPAPATAEVAARAAGRMRAGAILCDLCSVKVQPVQAMLEAYSGPVVGTHPLFGPTPGDAARVAVMPGRGYEAAPPEDSDCSASSGWAASSMGLPYSS